MQAVRTVARKGWLASVSKTESGALSPLIIPDVVIRCLRRWMKGDPMAYLQRPAPVWDGLSPIEWVRSGHEWDEVLTKLTRFFEGEISA